MDFEGLFHFLFVEPDIDQNTVVGTQVRAIIEELTRQGFAVHTCTSEEDARLKVEQDPSIGCFVIAWQAGFPQKMASPVNPEELLLFIRNRGLEAPVYLTTTCKDVTGLPQRALAQIKGCIFPQEESAPFAARYLARAFREYVGSLKTPFFGGMVDYVDAGNDMWLAPGHNGGVYYQRSPIGRVFHEYIGERFFRADFNFVPELGDIFGHTGPFYEAEKAAAEVFGAERTYFVLNGTTTSNKIVNCSLVAEGDLVLYDRNNHKSNVQSAMMINGGIPIYLGNDRNNYGMVGPIDYSQLDEQHIRQLICDSPLVDNPDAVANRKRPFRMAILENCTYDGTIYNVRTIMDKLGPLCDYILFDEAWGGFMAIHPIYRGRYGLGLTCNESDAGIMVTQSTHKQLAGMSQASQIHVADSHLADQPHRLDHKRLNEVYMMHSSTSPFYPMFASLDVGAQMLKGRNGAFLWEEAIELGIDIRKKVRDLKQGYAKESGRGRWFFEPFVPPEVTNGEGNKVPWEKIPTKELAADQRYWMLQEGESWHGYKSVRGDFAMLDPTKLILLTPGTPGGGDGDDGYDSWGIPAGVVGKFLRSRGIVPEKTDFNLVLFLMTPGIERSKTGKLLAELVQFKELFDCDAPLGQVNPDVVRDHPERYGKMSVGQLCQGLHELLKASNAKEIQRRMFAPGELPRPVMTPRAAQNAFVANRIDLVPLSELSGRVAATLNLAYPPGVGVVMPGERYERDRTAALAYFELFEEMHAKFPGYESELQGLYLEDATKPGSAAHDKTFYTYVVRETELPPERKE